MRLTTIFGALALYSAIACGGGKNSGGDNGGDTGGTTTLGAGSLVYAFVDTINGNTESAVHVLDLKSGTDAVFQQPDAAADDVGVSSNGTIVQFIEGDDHIDALVTDALGREIHSWGFDYPLSFLVDGPQISPDGTKVAFTLNVAIDDDRDNVVIIVNADGTALGDLHAFRGRKNVTWTPDNRVLMVDYVEFEPSSTIYVSDASLTTESKVNTSALDDVENPVMTPDGKYVVYDLDTDVVYALEIATQAITPLTKDGVNQFRPTLSPDGKHLAFQQLCCSANAIPAVYVIPFDPTKTVSADYDAIEPLKDKTGDIVNAEGRLGWY